MEKKLNISQIASQTGLSISTVSRVLAGKNNTSERAKKQVMAVARQLGVLDGMAAGRMLLNNILLFAPQRAFDERSDIFYYRVIQSISKTLGAHDVHLRYCALEENDSDAGVFLRRFNQGDAEAAILLGIDDPHIHDLAVDMGKPCVLINCRDRKMRLPAIAPDHRGIGELAASYLFDMGHRRILNLLCLRRYTMELRLGGIRDAWREHNLTMQEPRDLLLVRNFSAKESEERIAAYLEQTPRDALPTAILAGGDFMAAGAMRALNQHGLRVPQDMSVMSIDGFNLSAIQDVPLSSVHVPRDELGEEAVHVLRQLIIRPEAARSTLLLHGTLVSRESVRRIRSTQGNTAVDREGLYD